MRRGFVRVYKSINGNWTKIGQDIKQDDNALVFDYVFGLSISLSGDGSTIAISNPDFSQYNKHIQIFKNMSNSWSKIGEFSYNSFTDETPSIGKSFAHNISISSNASTIAYSDLG